MKIHGMFYGSLLILAAIRPVILAESPSPGDEIDRRIGELRLMTNSNNDRSWMDEAMRQAIIDRILKTTPWDSKDSRYEGKIAIAEERLVSLGHIPTIQKQVAKMQQPGNFLIGLEQTAREETLPYLIPLVADGSRIAPESEGVRYKSVQRRAARTILYVVQFRHTFPEKTRKWAGEMTYSDTRQPLQERYDLLLEWWKHNERAILERRYEQANWLPRDYKRKPSSLSYDETREKGISSGGSPALMGRAPQPAQASAVDAAGSGVPHGMSVILFFFSGLGIGSAFFFRAEILRTLNGFRP